MPKIVRAEVSLRWRRAGEVWANFLPDTQQIADVWMPSAPVRAGIYRISINLASGRAIYIGESSMTSRRLFDYTRAYDEEKKTPETRVSREIRKALAEGRLVVVDVATTGRINLTGEERPLNMRSVSERRFAEAAAVLAEDEQDVEGQVIPMNRILGEDWWLYA